MSNPERDPFENIPEVIPLDEELVSRASRHPDEIPEALPFGEAGDSHREPLSGDNRDVEGSSASLPQPGFGIALLWCLAFLFVTQVLPAVIVMTIYLLQKVVANEDIPANFMGKAEFQPYLQFLMQLDHLFAFIFCILLLRYTTPRREGRRDWLGSIAARMPNVSHLGLVTVLAPALFVVAVVVESTIHELITRVVGGDQLFEGMQQFMEALKAWPLFIAIALIAAGPAVNEELFCRAFLGRGFMARYGPFGAIVLTSMLFGAIHIAPAQGIMAAMMGVPLFLLYYWGRSLLLPILLHFLNNGLAMVLESNTTSHLPGIADFNHTLQNHLFLLAIPAVLVVAAVFVTLNFTKALNLPPLFTVGENRKNNSDSPEVPLKVDQAGLYGWGCVLLSAACFVLVVFAPKLFFAG
jgi:membrane protease YdiL (CAAX protease family)